MIQASELRIGNWVAKNGNWYQLNINNFIEYVTSNPEPIPLTPEILKKAGFVYSAAPITGVIHYSKGDVKFIVRDGGYSFYSWHKTSVKFVHQLQNLYFDLTGEELEVKL